jgi:5'-3' exonuclease
LCIIALDGLVPYGKIVQQRYRRMRVKEDPGSFDRNQISPETPYMKDLEKQLRIRFPYAILSGTSEPGEGEHKLFQKIRELPEEQRKSVCIYGLDADLILLCLIHHKLSRPHSMWLLRESSEFNDPKLKCAEFSMLSIWKLSMSLPIPVDQYAILCILCFGNDFMPNLGLFSLREDGYSRAIQYYIKLGLPNLKSSRGRNVFLQYAANQELIVLTERISLRKRPEERAILGKDIHSFSRKYGLHVLDGVQNMKPVVESFWKTFHWTYYYFIRNVPINWNWFYPYPDAPLITDIVEYAEVKPVSGGLNFTTTEQLRFILPAKSLRIAKKLVRFSEESYTETRMPWLKKYDWEMKPRISLPWNPTESLTSISLL